MKNVIKIIPIILICLLVFAGCREKSEDAVGEKVCIEMENGGKITMVLYPEYAPITVQNFLNLVDSGFYDGLMFHRVIDDQFGNFMAQGGDPALVEGRKRADSIVGEFATNGYRSNALKHRRGIVSMARTDDKNSASSQFFIMYEHRPHLDGDYAAFGEVIEGMNVVDDFLKIERDDNGFPSEPIVMKRVYILE
ncbi:MAG: peptidylprolyl isomerase [Oscillospiraceae bacterium]|nr:peptidylprolyl isomerase [Oscillospiraceae bacterium]